MKSREFGTWPPRNVLGADRQHLYDEYNRAFKRERPPQPKEYASSDVAEYYRVSEMKDVSGDPNEQSHEALSQISDRGNNAKASRRQLMLRQAICLLAGSVVIVTTYQAMAAQQSPSDSPAIVEPNKENTDRQPGQEDDAQQSPSDSPAIVVPVKENTDRQPGQEDDAQSMLSPSWKWSEDNQTAVLELYDSEGNLIDEIPVSVSVSEEAATCNREGLKTYTAAAESDGYSYTDTRSEPIPPLGHTFDSGTSTVLDNGQTAMVFTCTRCHEQFTVATSYTEND